MPQFVSRATSMLRGRDGSTKAGVARLSHTDLLVALCRGASSPSARERFLARRSMSSQRRSHRIAVATATVSSSVVHEADTLDLATISAPWAAGRRGAVTQPAPEDLQGGTFTISNLGMFASTTPGDRQRPQAAILRSAGSPSGRPW